MTARRLLLFAAVLMLLAALAFALAPGPGGPEPTPGPATARSVDVIERELKADGTDQSIVARVGDLIRFEVAGDYLDQVEIERLDRIDPIEPLTPARFEVIADAAGVYPIRLVDADRRIGRLDIRP